MANLLINQPHIVDCHTRQSIISNKS